MQLITQLFSITAFIGSFLRLRNFAIIISITFILFFLFFFLVTFTAFIIFVIIIVIIVVVICNLKIKNEFLSYPNSV